MTALICDFESGQSRSAGTQSRQSAKAEAQPPCQSSPVFPRWRGPDDHQCDFAASQRTGCGREETI